MLVFCGLGHALTICVGNALASSAPYFQKPLYMTLPTLKMLQTRHAIFWLLPPWHP